MKLKHLVLKVLKFLVLDINNNMLELTVGEDRSRPKGRGRGRGVERRGGK